MNNNTIKVLVLVGNVPLAQKLSFADGTTQYKGLYYDMWKIMKTDLSNKYQLEESYLEINNDNTVIDLIHKGTYDICIGPFTPMYERLKIVNFTKSIILDSPSILHFKNRTFLSTLYLLIKDVFIFPLVLIILLSLVIGSILILIDSERWGKLGIKKVNYFRKSFLVTISSFIGEAGLLTDYSSLKIYNIITIIFILTISSIITVYIQANATSKIINLDNEGIFNRHNIIGKMFVTQTGYDDGELIQKWGGSVTYVDKSVDEIVKDYLQNPSNYKGVVLDRTESQSYLNKYRFSYHNLTMSFSDFGYITECFPIHKNEIEFLNDVNSQILKLQSLGFTENICKMYRDSSEISLCVN